MLKCFAGVYEIARDLDWNLSKGNFENMLCRAMTREALKLGEYGQLDHIDLERAKVVMQAYSKLVQRKTDYMTKTGAAKPDVWISKYAFDPTSWIGFVWGLIFAPRELLSQRKDTTLASTTKDWLSYFLPNLQGNRITKTEGGLLASIPAQGRPGDVIVIIYSCRRPFLLRPRWNWVSADC